MIASSKRPGGLSNEEWLSRLHVAYPLIDTALIAAMLSDTNDAENRPEAIDDLLGTFELLTLQAKTDQEYLPVFDEDSPSSLMSDERSMLQDGSVTSATSSGSPMAMNSGSPLAFLKAAFPYYSQATLEGALLTEQSRHAGSEDDLDMEAIVQDILNRELITEMEERGWEEVDVQQDAQPKRRDWDAIAVRKGSKKARRKSGKDPPKMRQPQSPPPAQNARHPSSPSLDVDPWTHLSSLASRLAELLPPLRESHFLSLFHDPQHASPTKALRTELSRIGARYKPSSSFGTQLALVRAVVSSEDDMGFDDLPDLCLKATEEDVETAMELFWLLKDLESFEPVVAHFPITKYANVVATSIPKPRVAAKAGSSFTPLTTANEVDQSTSSTQGWTQVMRRPRPKPISLEIDPLAAFIPAYKNMPAGWRMQTGRDAGEPELSERLSEDECRQWADYYLSKRDEAFRDASKYWRKNWTGNRGGDVALVYTQDAREHDRRSKAWALKAARTMVDSRQRSSMARNTIDLHGLTVREALTLSREATNDWWNAAGLDGDAPRHPFTIITGRGNHSKGRVGVLGPAVQNALEADGWKTSDRTGAIIVSGLKRRRR